MKKLLYIFSITAAVCLYSCSTMNEPSDNVGELKGKFSVSAKEQVQFSQGNLQYQASTNTWRFAEKQYDIIGKNNKNVSIIYEGWIDVFGWGTGYEPAKTSEEDNDYTTFVDWGYNAISNGGNKAKFWRALDAYEWKYLFCERSNASTLFGFGNINGANGIILLPDDWIIPNGVTFTPSSLKGLVFQYGTSYHNSNNDNYTHNTYTVNQWSIMESSGAVFLPAAGLRSYFNEMSGIGSEGYYWSSTFDGAYSAYFLYFDNEKLFPMSIKYHLHEGRSVRLVRNVE